MDLYANVDCGFIFSAPAVDRPPADIQSTGLGTRHAPFSPPLSTMGKTDNPMRELAVEKLVLNICVGTSGDPLEKARRVLKQLTGLDGTDGQEPVFSKGATSLPPPPPPRCFPPAATARPASVRSDWREVVRSGATPHAEGEGLEAISVPVVSPLFCPALYAQPGTPSVPSRSVVTKRSRCT